MPPGHPAFKKRALEQLATSPTRQAANEANRAAGLEEVEVPQVDLTPVQAQPFAPGLDPGQLPPAQPPVDHTPAAQPQPEQHPEGLTPDDRLLYDPASEAQELPLAPQEPQDELEVEEDPEAQEPEEAPQETSQPRPRRRKNKPARPHSERRERRHRAQARETLIEAGISPGVVDLAIRSGSLDTLVAQVAVAQATGGTRPSPTQAPQEPSPSPLNGLAGAWAERLGVSEEDATGLLQPVVEAAQGPLMEELRQLRGALEGVQAPLQQSQRNSEERELESSLERLAQRAPELESDPELVEDLLAEAGELYRSQRGDGSRVFPSIDAALQAAYSTIVGPIPSEGAPRSRVRRSGGGPGPAGPTPQTRAVSAEDLDIESFNLLGRGWTPEQIRAHQAPARAALASRRQAERQSRGRR